MGIANVFKSKDKRREEKKRKELGNLCKNFKTLEELEKYGLILWGQKNRRLFLEEPIANLMMVSEESWNNFLRNCFTWIYYNECMDAVNGAMMMEELKAVRHAKKKCNTLSMRDINRIKEARRKEITFADIESKTPEVKAFEIYVIRANSEAMPKSKNKGGAEEENEGIIPGGEISCVGTYDPNTDQFDIALWEDVKVFMEQGKTEE